jgi:uncharacterized protein YkwD
MMRSILVCAVMTMLLAGCASDPAPKFNVTALSTNEAAEAAALISAYRVSRGLSPVAVNGRLNRAAEQQARTVAAAGQLDHGDFPRRMDAFGIMGYSAENLTAGRQTVTEAVDSWKASPPHNRNLLMPQARHVGLARADSASSYRRYWALVLGQ